MRYQSHFVCTKAKRSYFVVVVWRLIIIIIVYS